MWGQPVFSMGPSTSLAISVLVLYMCIALEMQAPILRRSHPGWLETQSSRRMHVQKHGDHSDIVEAHRYFVEKWRTLYTVDEDLHGRNILQSVVIN